MQDSQDVIHFQNSNFLQHHKEEPSIGFSPDRGRFEGSPHLRSSSATSLDITDLLLDHRESRTEPPKSVVSQQPPHQSSFEQKVVTGSGTQLQKRLERHIAQANTALTSITANRSRDESSWPAGNSGEVINPPESTNGKLKVQNCESPSHPMISSGSDSRSKALLPPQRLAVPRRPNTTANTSPHLHTQEAKPLVQWDSEDSEEELSFFPQSKAKARLTDNLSVDNLSFSGEEEDLHLTPPRLAPPGPCPCDPRPFLEAQLRRLRRTKLCAIT